MGEGRGLETTLSGAFLRSHSRMTRSSSVSPARRSSSHSVREGSMFTITRLDSEDMEEGSTATGDRNPTLRGGGEVGAVEKVFPYEGGG